jgi:hypothetical protein
MTTTFKGATLPEASKISEEPAIRLRETVLMSGYSSIQSKTITGFGASYSCLCTWAEYKVILALVGSSGSLVTAAGETYTYCYISALRVQETDSPGSYQVDVSFRQGIS